jgi:hypothetical protein
MCVLVLVTFTFREVLLCYLKHYYENFLFEVLQMLH